MTKRLEWPLAFGWELVSAFRIPVHVALGSTPVVSTVSHAVWLAEDRLATMPSMILSGEPYAQLVCPPPRSQSGCQETTASARTAFLSSLGKTERLSRGTSQL